MESAASIRQQPFVIARDTTDHFGEHGIRGTDVRALEVARQLAQDLASSASITIDAHLRNMVRAGQNPYRDLVHVDGNAIRHATVVDLSPEQFGIARLASAFRELSQPDFRVLSTRALAVLRDRVAAAGYEIAAAERGSDGTLTRIALRDPLYAAAQGAPDTATAQLPAVVGSTVDHGVRFATSTEKLREVECYVAQQADAIVERFADDLRGAHTAVDPQLAKPKAARFDKSDLVVVDPARIRRGLLSTRVAVTRSFFVGTHDEILERFRKRFSEADVRVDGNVLLARLRQAVAERLQKRPELGVAVVAKIYQMETLLFRGGETGMIVVRGEVARPWWRRLLGIAAPEPAPVATIAALPAPATFTVPPIPTSDLERVISRRTRSD